MINKRKKVNFTEIFVCCKSKLFGAIMTQFSLLLSDKLKMCGSR